MNRIFSSEPCEKSYRDESRAVLPRLRGAIAVSALLLACAAGMGQTQEETSVRVAFVFNLTKYVTWPQPATEIWIGFQGDSAVGDTLKRTLDGKMSEGHAIHVQMAPSDLDAEKLQVLYVDYQSDLKNQQAVAALRGKAVLTIGESDAFARQGGMVSLVRMGERIQIQINPDAVQAGGLKVSSHVLSLATLVQSHGAN